VKGARLPAVAPAPLGAGLVVRVQAAVVAVASEAVPVAAVGSADVPVALPQDAAVHLVVDDRLKGGLAGAGGISRSSKKRLSRHIRRRTRPYPTARS
jgi:hypothetical protein